MEWVTHKNIEDFKGKLAEEKDPEKRRILEALLAQEEEKLRQRGNN
jgi:hypothetical protein